MHTCTYIYLFSCFKTKHPQSDAANYSSATFTVCSYTTAGVIRDDTTYTSAGIKVQQSVQQDLMYLKYS